MESPSPDPSPIQTGCWSQTREEGAVEMDAEWRMGRHFTNIFIVSSDASGSPEWTDGKPGFAAPPCLPEPVQEFPLKSLLGRHAKFSTRIHIQVFHIAIACSSRAFHEAGTADGHQPGCWRCRGQELARASVAGAGGSQGRRDARKG